MVPKSKKYTHCCEEVKGDDKSLLAVLDEYSLDNIAFPLLML